MEHEHSPFSLRSGQPGVDGPQRHGYDQDW